MSIDVGYIPDNRRFSVAATRDPDRNPSNLIGIVGLGFANGNIRILRRIYWILNGSWRGLHGSSQRVWRHVDLLTTLRCQKRSGGGRKKRAKFDPLRFHHSQWLNEVCCCR